MNQLWWDDDDWQKSKDVWENLLVCKYLEEEIRHFAAEGNSVGFSSSNSVAWGMAINAIGSQIWKTI